MLKTAIVLNTCGHTYKTAQPRIFIKVAKSTKEIRISCDPITVRHHSLLPWVLSFYSYHTPSKLLYCTSFPNKNSSCPLCLFVADGASKDDSMVWVRCASDLCRSKLVLRSNISPQRSLALYIRRNIAIQNHTSSLGPWLPSFYDHFTLSIDGLQSRSSLILDPSISESVL